MLIYWIDIIWKFILTCSRLYQEIKKMNICIKMSK